jgi:hypothetical protein
VEDETPTGGSDMKNQMGKMRKEDQPYMIFEGGPFGDSKVLKSWQGDDAKPYARWFMAINGDLGDTYVSEVVSYGRLKYIDPVLVEAGYEPPTRLPATSF